MAKETKGLEKVLEEFREKHTIINEDGDIVFNQYIDIFEKWLTKNYHTAQQDRDEELKKELMYLVNKARGENMMIPPDTLEKVILNLLN